MKKYFIFSLLLVLTLGLCAPLAFAQTTGSVKGVCKDTEGKPLAGVTVEWNGIETGRTYTLKTNSKEKMKYFFMIQPPGMASEFTTVN